MIPVAAPSPTSPAAPSLSAPRPRTRSARALARGRSALLQLARSNGEVRLRIGDGTSAPEAAAELAELLDDLNGAGLLRYGGLRNAHGGRELVYHPA